MPHGIIENDLFGFSVLNYYGLYIFSALVHQNMVSVNTVFIMNITYYHLDAMPHGNN
jgi:hydroxymethylpyrimidine/phosphomethylpyrimidine kinase